MLYLLSIPATLSKKSFQFDKKKLSFSELSPVLQASPCKWEYQDSLDQKLE